MVKPLSKHRKISLILVLLAGLVLMGQSGGGTTIYLPFITKTTPPLAATSYYIQNADPSRLNALGCDLGVADMARPGSQDNLVILDFGKMWTYEVGGNLEYGVRLFADDLGIRRNLTLNQLKEAAQEFAKGYWNCTDLDKKSHLTLGVGTNNYDHFNSGNTNQDNLRTLAGDFGRNWAKIINDLNEWAVQQGYGSQVTFTGAIDIEWAGAEEDGIYYWNTPFVTLGWVNEFTANSHDTSIFFNYGACVGCPVTVEPSWYYTDQMPWSQNDVWYVSWGALSAYAVPEIYRNDGYLARQWAAISQYGQTYLKTSRIVFSGVMTQWGACQQRGGSDPTCATLDNTPEEGWYQLVNALIAINDPTPYPRWSTDIRWQIK